MTRKNGPETLVRAGARPVVAGEGGFRNAPAAADLAAALGRLHFARRDPGRALACFEEAVRGGTSPDVVAADRWKCRMMLGDFEGAWRESDGSVRGGAESAGGNGRGDPVFNLWDGRPPDGRRVMIRCYHGLGDTIQFIRYAPLLRRVSAWTGAEVQPVLFDVLRGLDGLDELFAWEDGRPRPGFDAEIECMELPRVFRTTLRTVPAEVPYLQPPEGLAAAVESALGPRRGLRIGLQWTASEWNPERSIPLPVLEPLARVPGTAFHRLPDGRGPSSRTGSAVPVAEIDSARHDLPWTAAAVAAMDAIVTVDTMTAHLAGALGKPVFVLLPFRSDWRWLIGRDDTPWYPTMHLFRQPRPGDWGGAVARMTAALSILAGG